MLVRMTPIHEVLRQLLATSLTAAGYAAHTSVEGLILEHPGDSSHGDYATNVALVLAKKVGESPRAVAEKIVALFPTHEAIAKLDIAGAGFINITLSREFLQKSVTEAVLCGDAWGKDTARKGQYIVFEYTSPNLFKPLHIGNLVGNIIGESLTRLFEASGATVKRVNYPSDIGPTVAKGVWGLTQTKGNPDDINALGEAYRIGNAAYESDPEAKQHIDEVNKKLYENTDADLGALRARGLKTSRARLAELCQILGTSFDSEIPESEAAPAGAQYVRNALGTIFEESEGAVVYRGEKVGLHTRVFLNAKGFPTYEAKDLGNFSIKQSQYPSLTHSYIVTGAEQAQYFKVVFAAIREVFPDAHATEMRHIPTGFLTLTTGKMSSRLGNVVPALEFIETVTEKILERMVDVDIADKKKVALQVAVGAIKYAILRSGTGKDILFDLEKSISFEGDSGPYLQYTHARLCSVIAKAKALGVREVTSSVPETPYALERMLYRFPEVLAKAATLCEPHHVVTYLVELASEFNAFYAHERIADASDTYASYKLAMAHAVQLTLKNGLQVLGIAAPEAM